MCGIAGIVSFQDRPVDLDLLQEMTDRQAHRGPDGEGFLLSWLESGGFCHALVPHTRHWDGRARVRVALGHRRLAILDLSRSEEHTSELQSQSNLVCRLLLVKKKIHK